MAKKTIYIFGNMGNMATRYKFYLEYLGCKVIGHDYDEEPRVLDLGYSDGVIVCTPTDQHYDNLCYLSHVFPSKPVLCEKAISTNLANVEAICNTDLNLRMINQYEYWRNYFVDGEPSGYDYFRHGADGLAWDCINILGMSTGSTHLAEQSPVWSCILNGHRLNLGDMDAAYIWNLSDWLLKEDENKAYIRHAHRKVYQWING